MNTRFWKEHNELYYKVVEPHFTIVFPEIRELDIILYENDKVELPEKIIKN